MKLPPLLRCKKESVNRCRSYQMSLYDPLKESMDALMEVLMFSCFVT